jgi:hypothetical protein
VEEPTITKSKKGMAGPEFNKTCSLFFSMWRGVFTIYLFLLTLQSTQTFTVMFRDAWEKMCNEKDRNFGVITTSSFIMTTRLPTHPWKP